MQYALVTGATSGIGMAISAALLKDGCHVFLNYAHNDERAKSVGEQLSEYTGSFDFICADMSDYEGVERIEAFLSERGVRLSYLILNFGETDRTPFDKISISNWERVMRSNVSVPFFLIQSLYNARLFAEGASILAISSLMASQPHSMSASYGVSKAGLSALCRNLVKFLSPDAIRINAVEPGFVDTPWQKLKPPEQRARIECKISLGRFAEPNEIAEICVSMLKNTYLTGSVVEIGGGYGLF